MFTSLGSGYFSAKAGSNHFVFHYLSGDLFLVTPDLHERITTDGLTEADVANLAAVGYEHRSDVTVSKQTYSSTIDRYINGYRGPSVLDLAISELCNLNCHMCIHAYAVEKGRPRKSQKIMPLETAIAWIDYYLDVWSSEADLHHLSFHFGAAEPMLNKNCLLGSIRHIQAKPTILEKEILINTNCLFAIVCG